MRPTQPTTPPRRGGGKTVGYLAELAALVGDVAQELPRVVVDRDLVQLHQLLPPASAEDQVDWRDPEKGKKKKYEEQKKYEEK